MNKNLQKINRSIRKIRKVLMLRKNQVNIEAYLLRKLQQEKSELSQQLEVRKSQYLSCVEDINKTRSSTDRNSIDIYESSLDHVKDSWIETLRSIERMQLKIDSQKMQLIIARRAEKKMEKLLEGYSRDVKVMSAQEEQKELDEVSIKRFLSR